MLNYSLLNIIYILKKNIKIIIIFIIAPVIIGFGAGDQSFEFLIERALGFYTKDRVIERLTHALNVLVPFFIGINIFIIRFKYETSLILLR